MKIINAGEIKVGYQLAERDGFLWDVTEIIKETARTITVRVNSDFSSFRAHWKTGSGLQKTLRKTSRIYAITEEA